MFIGHDHLVKDFSNLVKENCLAQGYIFFGEPQVGKFYFAKHLANLLENKSFEISHRPLQDALVLEDATGIDSMRELKGFLWQKPAISSKRLVIINNADNLTSQAENAILKITEEPPEHGMIILITSHLENIMPTILSRMQKIYFGRLSDNEMGKVLDNKEIVSLSFGRPGRAMSLLNDPSAKEASKYVAYFLKSRGPEHSNLIKDLIEQQKENPKLLDLFFEELTFQLRKDKVKNVAMLKSVLERLSAIKGLNTNKRLQLEAI
mgnify:CR=1 FL=1